MLKKRFFNVAVLIVASAIIVGMSNPLLGRITAYNSYDTAIGSWEHTLSTNFIYTHQGTAPTHEPTGNGYGFPAGNSDFGGCAEFNPPSGIYHHDYDGVIWNNTEGTIEVWIAPHWDGENQGGVHPGATYQDIIIGDGTNEWQGGRQGFNVFFFDNNYGPTPGYQLFVVFTDDDVVSPTVIVWEHWLVGNTMDWTAGSWHHVCISWDATEVMAGIDGTIFGKKTRNGGFDMASGGYLFEMGRATPTNCWDGWMDDMAVYDHAKYTGYGDVNDPYPMPTTPAFNLDELYKAKVPEPNDLEINVSKNTNLDWEPGDGAVTHLVYFDSVESNVENRIVSPIIVSAPTSSTAVPGTPLTLGQTYYWAVDEVDSTPETHTGDLWQFDVETGNAINPKPYDDEMDVYRHIEPSWELAPSTVTQYAYMSDNESEVQSRAVTPIVVTAPDNEITPPIDVASNKRYYWAVDSVDDTAATHTGDVWEFQSELKALPALVGDISQNYEVDLRDIGILASQYLQEISVWDFLCAELDELGDVDVRDYIKVADNWGNSDIPLGFEVLGTIVPPAYDPPPTHGYTEQFPTTNITPPTFTSEEITRGYVVYANNYLLDIYPRTKPDASRSDITDTISGFSAPGEYEPVTFTIYSLPGNTLSNVSVTIGDLTGPAGAVIKSSNIEVRSVRCWPRRVWNQSAYTTSPTFLEKRSTLNVAADTSQKYWITVWVPADTAAGTYSGTVSINVGSHANYALSLNFDVLDIQLIKPPTLQGMYYHALDHSVAPPWPNYPDAYYYKEIMNMKEHGMDTLMMGLYVEPTGTIKDGNVVYDLNDLDYLIQTWHDAGFKNVVWNVSVGSFLPGESGPSSFPANVKGFHDQLLANGWNRPVASVGDEGDAHGSWPSTKGYLSSLKTTIPAMKNFSTIVYPQNSEIYEPVLDIRAFSSYMDENAMTATRAAGRELWMYSGPGERGKKANRFYRGFWATAVDLDGVLAWVYYYLYDHNYDFDDLGRFGQGGPNIRGWVFPGDGGPLPSPEWECSREGIEDNKYIHTLQTLIDLANASGNGTLIAQAATAQSYLDSLFAGIDTSVGYPSVFPCSREAAAVTDDFMNDARLGMATHIKTLSDGLAAL